MVAAFNAVVIGFAAVVLGVPLAGSIAVIKLLAASIPFVGAWTAGIFTVLIALGAEGPQTAALMALIVLLANGVLQQIVQPIAYGPRWGLHPLAVLIVTICGRQPVRDDRPGFRGPADCGRRANLGGPRPYAHEGEASPARPTPEPEPGPAARAEPPPPVSAGPLSRLVVHAKQLLDSGAISQAEFEQVSRERCPDHRLDQVVPDRAAHAAVREADHVALDARRRARRRR